LKLFCEDELNYEIALVFIASILSIFDTVSLDLQHAWDLYQYNRQGTLQYIVVSHDVQRIQCINPDQ
jgi:hypothetical protein